MSGIVEIRIGCPDAGTASRIAEAVVESRLGAAAHVLAQHETHYRWQGETVSGNEVTVVVRTRAALFARVAESVTDLHPFEVPSIVAFPVAETTPAYRAWIESLTEAG